MTANDCFYPIMDRQRKYVCPQPQTRCECGFINNDPLLDRQQAADYLGLKTKHTLKVWDCTGKYDLQPIKFGKRNIRYKKSSLDKHLNRRLKR